MLIKVSEIQVDPRLRQEMGDIDELANSINEYGIIQPIVIEPLNGGGKPAPPVRLVAGERRLRAIRKLGWAQLEYGKHFVWLDDINRNELRRTAIELEENLRRKELSWQEQIAGKQKLLELMQAIHGAVNMGAPTKIQQLGIQHPGFGVNKLAAMLGESPAKTSQDLSLARAVKILPSLKKQTTKTAAMRQAQVLISIASMAPKTQVGQTAPAQQQWTLHEGPFEILCPTFVADESVDLVYTDLPYGVDLDVASKHATGTIGYDDQLQNIIDLVPDVAYEAYRVLRPDRYAVLFFGFRYYARLVSSLGAVGFMVDPMPFIWYKHSRSSEHPHMIYARTYDAAIVARKGSPVFIRQGQVNLVDIPIVNQSSRLHSAQQPIELVERFIKDMLAPGATIVDFFAGSGTTGVAALRCNCDVILFEKDKLCQEAIKARMSQTQSQVTKMTTAP